MSGATSSATIWCWPRLSAIGERLGRPRLAARIVPQQSETDEEQQPRQHSSER